MDTIAPLAPLEDITDRQLKRLYTTLWNWKDCAAGTSTTHDNLGCPQATAGRVERLGPFREFYKSITARYLPEFAASGENALRSHDDLIEIVSYVKTRAGVQRGQLMIDYFTEQAERNGRLERPSWHDQERAFNLAARILTMVSCSAENQAGAFLEEGTRPITWANSDSLATFIAKSFPTTDHPSLNDPYQAEKVNKLKLSLEGIQLTKMAGLSFLATDNLASHLHLDVDKGYVEIFHHTRALKEYLIATHNDETAGSEDDLSEESYLPRQLALEVIDSIQKILFPLESDSEPLLRSLVVKQGIDPDCLRLMEPTPYRRLSETEISYHYFGGRLMDLAHELEHPTPRSVIDRWLERKSGARYVMLATLAGVATAILLGFVSVAVSVFQAWVSWQAWKYPAIESNSR